MKKTTNDIFDDAKAYEIDNLVSRNDVGDVSADTLSAIKIKVQEKIRLTEPHEKKYVRSRWYIALAAATCIVIVLVASIIIFNKNGNASSNKNTDNLLKNEIVNDLDIEGKIPENAQILNMDWPMYSNAEDLCNAATQIYTGIVRDISFEIIDYVTGKADASATSESSHRMLYTVYTISLTKSIKGNNHEEIKIGRIGGIVGYKEAEQYSKLESSGLLNGYRGLPVVADTWATLDIGKEYLFCTARSRGDYDFVINPTQFVHYLDSYNASLIMQISEKN